MNVLLIGMRTSLDSFHIPKHTTTNSPSPHYELIHELPTSDSDHAQDLEPLTGRDQEAISRSPSPSISSMSSDYSPSNEDSNIIFPLPPMGCVDPFLGRCEYTIDGVTHNTSLL